MTVEHFIVALIENSASLKCTLRHVVVKFRDLGVRSFEEFG